MTGVPDGLLRRLSRRVLSREDPVDRGVAAELLKRAAQCYFRASLLDDAARVYHELEDHSGEALSLERLNRFEPAARAYRRSAEWQHSARCFLRAGLPAEAAEDLVLADQILRAAWVLADEARFFVRATSLIERYEPRSDAERVGREVVIARCEAADPASSRAARRLREIAAHLPAAVPADTFRDEVWRWSFAVAEVLQRPDLTALLHAAAVRAAIPGAEQRWEEWTANLMSMVEETDG